MTSPARSGSAVLEPPVADTLAPEFRLAVACCLWPPGQHRAERVEDALAGPIDWELFRRVVKRQRIAGLAFHALVSSGQALPESARTSLRAAAGRLATQSLTFAGETIRLTDALATDGVPAACLKGAALSQLAFGNIALRHSRDIDLLIAPDHAFIADRVMVRAGYQLTMPVGPHTDARKRAWMKARKHFEYVHTSSGAPVELHWRLFDNTHLVRRDFGLSHWEAVPLGGSARPLLTLQRRDLLLYLCVHGANHMWFRLKWIADVNALLSGGDGTDMEDLVDDGKAIGASRAVAQALELRRTLFGDTPMRTAGVSATPRLVQSALRAMTAGEAATELEDVAFGTSRVALARYRLRADWRFWLQEARSGMLDERDRESSRLPSRLSFLLPLLRVPFWIARRAAGLGRSNR